MFTKIVTHPGDAHRDEFLACCFLLGGLDSLADQMRIERRNYNKEDLQNPRTLVLDQGMQLEPVSMNFDHHQLPRSAPPVCALTLVLQMMGADLSRARQIFPWLEWTEILDSKGPTAAADYLKCDRERLIATVSPIETTILRQFSQRTELAAYDPLFGFMSELGKEKLDYMRRIELRLLNLKRYGQWHDLDCVPVFDVTYIGAENDPTLGLEMHLQDQPRQAAVTITRENPARGQGFALFRRNDDPRIDFSLLEKDPLITFAHVQGFIAITKPDLEIHQLLELVRRAIVSKST